MQKHPTLALLLSALALFSVNPAFADELELVFYRAPEPLDWSSPGTLIRTTFRNSTKAKLRHENWRTLDDGSRMSEVHETSYPHAISHVNVKLQCGHKTLWRGMTGTKANFFYVVDLVFRGDALDTLITNTPGRFYTEEEIMAWLPQLKKEGYVRNLKVKLNEQQCARLSGYLADYEAFGLERIYGGLRSDPLLGQGAGCSAFAASFLRVLGLDHPEIEKAWKRRLEIPEDLITWKSHRSSIPFLQFLKGKNSRWAKAREPHVALHFWDPELMYRWAGEVKAGRAITPFPTRVEGNTVHWDARAQPVPSGNPFLLPKEQIRENAGFYEENADEQLSDAEVRNSRFGECRAFRRCR